MRLAAWLARRFAPAAAAVLSALVVPPPAAAQDIAHHLAGIDATFVVVDGASGKVMRHDASHAARRYAPCSTFKIANTAILLEAGAATDLDAPVRYDPALGLTNPDWARDLSLREAYRVSALWLFRDLARKAGIGEVRRVLQSLDFGNGRSGDRIRDRPFWVDGTLLVSADEQVDFLQRLHLGRLPLSERTLRLTREAMLAEATPRWRLSAKTGSCLAASGGVNLWYVGYVERAEATHYFALHMNPAKYQPLMDRRIPIARAILAELDILN
jgi:beta-lactamase class D